MAPSRSVGLSPVLGVVLGLLAAPVSAQSVGTFRWQLQPFCNVLTFSVSGGGAPFTLTGFDDLCRASVHAPAAGSATQNADGTFALDFVVVTPDGLASHTTVALNLSDLSGPWRDSAGNTGTFRFAPPSPTAGASVAAAPPAVAPMPTIVEYSTGRYELRGDGVTTPYVWVWIPNPPPAPPRGPEEPSEGSAPRASPGRIYRWTDEEGTTFWTNRPDKVPEPYRS